MDYKEKRLCVLKEIRAAVEMRDASRHPRLPNGYDEPTYEINVDGTNVSKMSHQDFRSILKLLDDEWVIDVKEWNKYGILSFVFTKGLAFDEGIKELTGPDDTIHNQDRGTGVWRITFSEFNREIRINDLILLSTPRLYSINHIVFSYLYKNPNRDIQDDELALGIAKWKKSAGILKGDEPSIDKAIDGKTIGKRYQDMIREWGFKNRLGKVFFTYGKGSIMLRNPVLPEQREEIGLGELQIGQLKEK